MQTLATWIAGHPVSVFYILLSVSLLINRLPVVGVFFRTVNTLLHESGHALGAILTSGEVIRIDIKKDTSGVAQTKSNSRFRAFIVSIAGYPFAALAGSFLLALAINEQNRLVLLILLSIMLIDLMLFVRNAYGIVWLLIFSTLLIFIAWFQHSLLTHLFVLFICMIAFTETFWSTITVTILGIMQPRKSGDPWNMQKTTGIPAAFWALVIFAMVMWIMYYTISHYFPAISQLFV